MLRKQWFIDGVTVVAWLLAAATLCAQMPPESDWSLPMGGTPPSVMPASPTVGIEEVKPSQYWLPDKNGNLQPVINIPYEVFEKVYRLYQQPQTPIQEISIEQLILTGSVVEQHAEMEAQLKIHVGKSGWGAVQLRMPEAAVVPGGCSLSANLPYFLQFDQANGYVLWLQSEQESELTCNLKFVLPVRQSAGQSQLKLTTPPAAQSTLTLTIEQANLKVQASDGVVVTALEQSQGKTTIKAVGQGGQLGRDGNLQLVWYVGKEQAVQSQATVEAQGLIRADIDGTRAALDGTITVRSRSGSFDRIRLRLPASARLILENQRWQIRKVSTSATENSSPDAGSAEQAAAEKTNTADAQNNAPSSDTTTAEKQPGAQQATTAPGEALLAPSGTHQLVDILLPELTTGPIEIRFVVETKLDGTNSERQLLLEGPEVIGARQSGFLAVTLDNNWQAVWTQVHGLERIALAELPQQLANNRSLRAAFRYAGHSFRLAALLLPRRSYLTVSGRYRITIDEGRIGLQASFQYTVSGKPLEMLTIDTRGWHVLDIGPQTTVAEFSTEGDGNCHVVLNQAVTGTFRLELRAEKPLDNTQQQLNLPLPVPQAQVIAPAELDVVWGENIEFLPDADSSRGLVRRSVQERVGEKNSLHYQARLPDAVVAGKLVVHDQQIDVAVDTWLDLRFANVQVLQKLQYDVQYRATDRVDLIVPNELVSRKALQVLYRSKPVELVPVPAQTGEETENRFAVMLSEPVIGPFELQVRFTLDLPRLIPQSSILLDTPLVMPSNGRLVHNAAHVIPRAGLLLQPHSEEWTGPLDASGWLIGNGIISLNCPHASNRLQLAVFRQDGVATNVEKQWIQVWLGTFGRQDRIVWQLQTDSDQLELVLPESIDRRELYLRMAAQSGGPWRRVQPEYTPQGTIRIWLPEPENDQLLEQAAAGLVDETQLAQATRRRVWLELVARRLNVRLRTGQLVLEFPRIKDQGWTRRCYLQIILPGMTHVVLNPAELSPEYHWAWTGWFWGRWPNLEQADLESWIGATHAEPPPQQTSRYVYSCFGTVSSCRLFVASRTLIVLVCSSIAFLLGMLFVHLPPTRSPITLLLTASVLGGLGALYPEQAALAAQAAAIGIATVLAAIILRVLLLQRWRSGTMGEASSILVERGSTQLQYRPLVAAGTEGETVPYVNQDSSGSLQQ